MFRLNLKVSPFSCPNLENQFALNRTGHWITWKAPAKTPENARSRSLGKLKACAYPIEIWHKSRLTSLGDHVDTRISKMAIIWATNWTRVEKDAGKWDKWKTGRSKIVAENASMICGYHESYHDCNAGRITKVSRNGEIEKIRPNSAVSNPRLRCGTAAGSTLRRSRKCASGNH